MSYVTVPKFDRSNGTNRYQIPRKNPAQLGDPYLEIKGGTFPKADEARKARRELLRINPRTLEPGDVVILDLRRWVCLED